MDAIIVAAIIDGRDLTSDIAPLGAETTPRARPTTIVVTVAIDLAFCVIARPQGQDLDWR